MRGERVLLAKTFLKAALGKNRNLPSFVRANRTAFWKISYFVIAAFLILSAAWKRFSLPQDPLADTDAGYLLPALMKLSGGTFAHIQGLNVLYPGLIYLILQICADFRAISVMQHFLGLIAGGLFLATWSRLGDFFPKPRLNRVAHEAIGLLGAGIYLFSYGPIFSEMQIRSDGVCMFFEILIIWLMVQFFYYRVISPNGRKAVVYGTATAVSAFLLASLKPSFTLMGVFAVAPVIWLIVNAKGNLSGKVAFFGITVSIIVALTLTEHYHRRNDRIAKMFLPETLFVIHAKIIHAQMSADLRSGRTDIYSPEWLRLACDDLEREIQRTHDLYPKAFPILGFAPDYLKVGADSLLNQWRRQLGDERFLRFLKYWYWHSVAHRPLAFAGKVARQLAVFYSTDCPAFSVRKIFRLAPSFYTKSLVALSQPRSLELLSRIPAGTAFLERTQTLCSSNVVVQQSKLARIGHVCCARSYLAILLISLPLAGRFVLKRGSSEQLKWPALLVVLLYSASFGNVLGISVIHSMEVARYSTVLFIAALFAHLWAVRWLVEIALTTPVKERAAQCGPTIRKADNAKL
ncbi:MAG: hypothetical protein DME98_14285 [Verrucomicrobia bacterium]|nr:MAG: hypothetical protein DME98_14285 [Verrucomicrobiota bacterium]